MTLGPVVKAATPTVPKVQNGLWYSFRSAAFWVGGTLAFIAIGELVKLFIGCGHTVFFKCTIQWGDFTNAVAIGVLINIGRFVQGFLAPRPPKEGG
jgi:hypothetical protein